MPVFMLLHTRGTRTPSHGVVIITRIQRGPHTLTILAWENYSGKCYTILYGLVSKEMAGSRMDVLTFFTTLPYLSKQRVNF